MLVITRKLNEVVRLGDDIEIHILRTGGHVQLGILAPDSVRVRRDNMTKTDHPPTPRHNDKERVPA